MALIAEQLASSLSTAALVTVSS